MSFFVMAQQRRFRVRYKNGEPFFFAFAKRPARRVFKEEFATRGGAETFREMVERARTFESAKAIPGSTRYEVITAIERQGLT